ncbi:MAG: hydroxymethylglutaryl-CoA lyase [Actinomycetota bacterium]|nr:hydroxymethylglutaryl-CoA lyase [Actinomycetota bacterium]MEC9059795.1 hydroxymethylglutaryl-CoA lyase [Actinomycetota bacterium]MED5361515.1 hydroxymethylglutaryl-CoA lyase [Actinomycetota bacterium]MEE3256612.1 hydroxymethylglutaryl-CoA lyase [Actinomycetota bacterium]
MLADLPGSVEIREVGPRDGLQNEDTIPIDQRIALIDALSGTGLAAIEAASFVHPKAIPPMAGSAEVMKGITRVPGVRYRALVPNERGALDALACDVDEIEVVMSVSETHNYKNINMSPDESVSQIIELTDLAHQEKTPVEAILSTAFGCAYEGDVSPQRVAQYARKVLDEAGVDGLSFGDTSGMATPRVVSELLDALTDVGINISEIGLHFHNTRNTGLANIMVAMQRGVSRFDAAIGGLGGCPYSPGATGNVATEDVVHMVEDLGATTGVDLDSLIDCGQLAEQLVGRQLPSQVLRSGPRTRTVAP